MNTRYEFETGIVKVCAGCGGQVPYGEACHCPDVVPADKEGAVRVMTDPNFIYVVVKVYPTVEIFGFNTAAEVAEFLWGKYLPRWAIFKNGEWLKMEGGEFHDFEKGLAASPPHVRREL